VQLPGRGGTACLCVCASHCRLSCLYSHKHGVFPDSLNLAKVVPICKKDDRRKPENYRPISFINGIYFYHFLKFIYLLFFIIFLSHFFTRGSQPTFSIHPSPCTDTVADRADNTSIVTIIFKLGLSPSYPELTQVNDKEHCVVSLQRLSLFSM